METGAQNLTINPAGDLIATLDGGFLRFQKPMAYQIMKGQKQEVSVSYVAKEQGRFSFSLGAYDPKQALVIHPALVWSTLLGGPGQDISEESLQGIAIDSSDNVYLTGSSSDGFPTTPGVYQPVRSGSYSAFVAKLNNTGTDLVYSTYLGGNDVDRGLAIQVDSNGCAYVLGNTNSENFPTTSGAFVENLTISEDIFVTKLNSTGTALVYSTLLGTVPGNTHCLGLDASGKVYISSSGISGLPTTSGAFDVTPNGGTDLFVACLNSTGTALHYATLVGGSQSENG